MEDECGSGLNVLHLACSVGNGRLIVEPPLRIQRAPFRHRTDLKIKGLRMYGDGCVSWRVRLEVG